MRSPERGYPGTASSKRTSGDPPSNVALKRNAFSVHTGTITQEMPLLFRGQLLGHAGRGVRDRGGAGLAGARRAPRTKLRAKGLLESS
jgi:hypothetical protein